MVTTEKQTEQRSLMAHLMRRAGFGVTQRELDELEELDYDGVVDSILDPGQSIIYLMNWFLGTILKFMNKGQDLGQPSSGFIGW